MDFEISSTNFWLMNQEFVKLDRLDGQNYIRWTEKVKFFLTVLKLGHVLNTELLAIPADLIPIEGQQPDQKAIYEAEKLRAIRRESKHFCFGHTRNSFSDHLYDLYAPVTDPKESWKDVSKRIMHKSEDYSLDDLLKHFCIEW